MHAYIRVQVVGKYPKAAIAVGLAARDTDMAQPLGHEEGSVAYHLDDGNLFIGVCVCVCVLMCVYKGVHMLD
jgi:hypothetical protein